MSDNFDFATAIKAGLRLGQERLKIKDRINEILNKFADELQKIISEENGNTILVQKKHIIRRKKISRLAALATIGLEEPPIEEEYDAICLFDTSTSDDPFVVFRYEINAERGYPCEVQYASNSFSCNDEKTLVASIQNAMKYRGLAISEKVRELVNNSNKKEKQ